MKKLILMLLLVVGGVMSASATRIYAHVEWGYGTNVRLYMYDSANYHYGGDWGTCGMTSLGNNWYYIDTWKPLEDAGVKTIIFNGGDDSQRISIESEYVNIKGKYLNVTNNSTASWEDLSYVAYSPTKQTILTKLSTVDGVNYTGTVSNSVNTDVLIAPEFMLTYGYGESSNLWSYSFRPWDAVAGNVGWAEKSGSAGIFGGNNNWYLVENVSFLFSFNIATDHNGNNATFSISPYFERTLNAAAGGYATFSSTYNVAVPEGLTAKYSTGVLANGKITWVDYDSNGIPANEGALLEGTAGTTYKFTPATAIPTSLNGTNILKPIATKQQLTSPAGSTAYILSKVSDKLGFYKVNSNGGSWVAAGTAYLEVPGTSTARDFYLFDDNETTSINTVEKTQANGQAYNLAGQRVAQPTKGLYIVNGKKVIMK